MRRSGRSVLGGAAAILATLAGLGLAQGPAAASARAVSEQVLYSFSGPDGAGPLNGVSVGPGGVLYGTTVFGGSHADGNVFTLSPAGAGWTERVLFSFDGKDGSKPGGNVVAGPGGGLFGTTVIGGAYGAGVVFELVPAGNRYTEKVLYSFTGRADGQGPVGAPVLDGRGDLFGVTQFGGLGRGVIYELTPSAGGYTEKVLHDFAADAGQPQAGLTRAADGALFGTLYGASAVDSGGSVFRLRPGASGPVYTDLYNFAGGTDGANPFSLLTVDNRTGVIYGTTEYGGDAGGDGTVFSLTPAGGGYAERVLYAFTGHRAGELPQAPLLHTADGDLYGTASIGGTGCSLTGCGTVFRLVPAGAGYAFRVIYRFTGPPDGAETDWAGLAAGPGGELFGTTRSGGTSASCSDGGPGGVSGCGTVYEITR